MKAATEVAERLGLAHEICPIEIGKYSTIADDVVRLSEGLLPMHDPAKTMHFLERLGSGCGYLMGGGPGDVLAGSYVPSAEYLDPLRADVLGSDFWARRNRGTHLPLIFSR